MRRFLQGCVGVGCWVLGEGHVLYVCTERRV
jgi:hypothetical protein